MGGAAYNGAVVFGPVGGLIGWLLGRPNNVRDKAKAETELNAENGMGQVPKMQTDRELGVISSILLFLAKLWNTHIDGLESIGLLSAFVAKPWLFAAQACIISVFFPPFLPVYFVAYVAAVSFGLDEANGYRAKLPTLRG